MAHFYQFLYQPDTPDLPFKPKSSLKASSEHPFAN